MSCWWQILEQHFKMSEDLGSVQYMRALKNLRETSSRLTIWVQNFVLQE